MGLSHVERVIPGARWLRGYTAQFFISDLIAGITVGLTVLPQGMQIYFCRKNFDVELTFF